MTDPTTNDPAPDREFDTEAPADDESVTGGVTVKTADSFVQSVDPQQIADDGSAIPNISPRPRDEEGFIDLNERGNAGAPDLRKPQNPADPQDIRYIPTPEQAEADAEASAVYAEETRKMNEPESDTANPDPVVENDPAVGNSGTEPESPLA